MNSGVDLESLSRWCELYLGARLDAVLFETGFSTRVLGGCATAMRSCLSYASVRIHPLLAMRIGGLRICDGMAASTRRLRLGQRYRPPEPIIAGAAAYKFAATTFEVEGSAPAADSVRSEPFLEAYERPRRIRWSHDQ